MYVPSHLLYDTRVDVHEAGDDAERAALLLAPGSGQRHRQPQQHGRRQHPGHCSRAGAAGEGIRCDFRLGSCRMVNLSCGLLWLPARYLYENCNTSVTAVVCIKMHVDMDNMLQRSYCF